MTKNQEIRKKCVEITSKAAVRIGIAFEGRDNEPYLVRAADLCDYVTEKDADAELRLACAKAAMETVDRRGFMHELLFVKIRQVETFILKEPAKAEISAEDKAEIPKKEKEAPETEKEAPGKKGKKGR